MLAVGGLTHQQLFFVYAWTVPKVAPATLKRSHVSALVLSTLVMWRILGTCACLGILVVAGHTFLASGTQQQAQRVVLAILVMDLSMSTLDVLMA